MAFPLEYNELLQLNKTKAADSSLIYRLTDIFSHTAAIPCKRTIIRFHRKYSQLFRDYVIFSRFHWSWNCGNRVSGHVVSERLRSLCTEQIGFAGTSPKNSTTIHRQPLSIR